MMGKSVTLLVNFSFRVDEKTVKYRLYSKRVVLADVPRSKEIVQTDKDLKILTGQVTWFPAKEVDAFEAKIKPPRVTVEGQGFYICDDDLTEDLLLSMGWKPARPLS
jgi:hypothetical protein